MRIFKHWTRVRATVEWNGRPLEISALGGSNGSVREAERDATERLDLSRRRIQGVPVDPDEYEADIVEEPLHRIDDRNVVTRNRYGAEVLNSSDHCFLDLDLQPAGFWNILTGRRDRVREVAARIAHVEKCMRHPLMNGRSARLYETHSGLRALVSGPDLHPDGKTAEALMKLLRADWLYAILCRKQRCYRARLTPKPYRIKARTMRFTYPRTPDGDEEAAAWVRQYEEHSEGFCVCRYVKSLGQDLPDPVVRYHDTRTGAHSGLRLA